MNVTAIVLAGGFGTRSADPTVPKTLQVLKEGVTVFDTISDCLEAADIRRVVAALGHLSNKQDEYFASRLSTLDYKSVITGNEGTSHATVRALENVNDDFTLVVNGDTALTAPLSVFSDFASSRDADIAFLARYSDHPQDSDSIEIDRDGRILGFTPKGLHPNPDLPVISLSGILLARTSVLRHLEPVGDLRSQLLKVALTENRRAFALLNRFFTRDTGTPRRLKSASTAIRSGAAYRRSEIGRGAVFIDRDDTLIVDKGSPRKSIEAREVDADMVDGLKRLNVAGIPWFIVTNQPDVAKGLISLEDVTRTFRNLQDILGRQNVFFDDFAFCPHHPETGWSGEKEQFKITCNCRKPATGMLDLLADRHLINLEKSVMIGDSWRDKEMAQTGGLEFIEIMPNRSNILAALDLALRKFT